jgi:hypothetical protein
VKEAQDQEPKCLPARPYLIISGPKSETTATAGMRLSADFDEAYRELAKVRTQKDLEIRSLSERIAAEKEYAEGLRVKLSSANHQVEDALEQVRALKFEISIYKKLGKVTVL